jgi:hypothetical protein
MKNEEGEREWERKGGRNRNRDRKGNLQCWHRGGSSRVGDFGGLMKSLGCLMSVS